MSDDKEFKLAVRIGLPKYFIFADGQILCRRKKPINYEQLRKIKEEILASRETMKYCNECKMVTHHRDGKCRICEADYYANDYDRGK